MSSHNPKGLHEVLLQQKRQMSMQLKAKFARFGDEVCGIITQEALKPNGILYLLQRLGLGSSRNFTHQLETLSRFMAEQGTGTFINRYRSREHHHEPSHAEPVPVDVSRGSLVFDERGRCVGSEPQASVRHKADDLAPAAQAGPPNLMHPFDGPVFDKNGNYIGPERRISGERRSGRDRRLDVDCIDSNRRYGGSRRHDVRRAEDRQKNPKELGMS